jgi:PAS domain S-box-containing protein
MKPDSSDEPRDHDQDLRQRAKDVLVGKPIDLEGLHTDDIQYLVLELQVHQAELAIQNEELRRVQLDLEISRDLFSDLYNFAPSGYCTLSQKGRILNANQTLADLFGIDQEKLLHRQLSEFVDSTSQDEYYLHCKRAFINHKRIESEILLQKPAGGQLIVRIESVIARSAPTQLMVMINDITDQRRVEKEQQKYVDRMDIQRRLIEQSEKERGELARNLHDGPIQGLAGLSFSLKMIKDDLKAWGVDGKVNLEQIGVDIQNLTAELRGICNDLRPPVLSRFGLRRALLEHAAEFQKKHEQPKLILEFPDSPTLIPQLIVLPLYRIYQQALSNIIRHAKASEVWVRLKFEPQQFLFEIQDNGLGFSGPEDWNEYARQGHLGLVGMKERAEAIGGRIELISQPGDGTLIRVSIPMANFS